MTFSVKRAIEEAGLEPFVFEDIDGNPAELPHLQTLTLRQAEMALNGQLSKLFEDLTPDSALSDQLVRYPAHVLMDLQRAWAEHSDIEFDKDGNAVMGKSAKPSASSTTPKPAPRSKRTSPSAASRSRK